MGDIAELGSWQEKKLMKRIPKKIGLALIGKKENLSSAGSMSSENEYYTYTFYTYRGKEQIYYYYIKKSNVIQSERRPGRVLLFKNQKSVHPYRKKVINPRGEIYVVD